MTHRIRVFVVLIVLPLILILASSASAQVDLRQYAKVYEVKSPNDPGQDIPLGDVIDRRHNVRITFEAARLTDAVKELAKNLKDNQTSGVKVRIEARLQHNNGQPLAIPVDNYSSVREEEPSETDANSSKTTTKKVSVVTHDKLLEAVNTGVAIGSVPDGYINLTAIGVESGDRLYINITDVKTQTGVNYVVSIGEYDWNLKVSDTFLLLKRLNVSKAEEAEGEKPVNFRPAPGVTFGYIYSGRKGIKKVLSPGFGYNVSFTDWNDPSFDISTGMFAKGTDASKVEITTGPIFSLFNNTLHFTYGWNLNARSDRKYWGIGFSFFNLSQKIAGLIKQ